MSSTTVFAKTIITAIRYYRYMLRKYLPQAERVQKLAELNLKNATLYENEVALFHTAHSIIADIDRNLAPSEKNGYYAYSGVRKFGDHLRKFLQTYELEGSQIIHRSQKASRALIKAIQLLATPEELLSREAKDTLSDCNIMIAQFGTEEQKSLHKNTLTFAIQKHEEENPSFLQTALVHYQAKLKEAAIVEHAEG